MRKILILTALVGAALAVEGLDGYSATQVVTGGDLRDLLDYSKTEPDARWGQLDAFSLGLPYKTGGTIAADADAKLYFTVFGSNPPDGALYTGLVGHDGTAFRHLVQDSIQGSAGTLIRAIAVSPVTAGQLTKGHPVLLKRQTIATGIFVSEVWSIDPGTAAQTLVHSWTGGSGSLAIDPVSGTIYASDMGNYTIRKISWNGVGYVGTSVPTTLPTAGGITIGPDGYLYAFHSSQPWFAVTNRTIAIYRIHPATGAYSQWAKVAGSTWIYDWAWSDDDQLWLALGNAKTTKRYVTFVVAGATTSQSDAIADTGCCPEGLAAAPNGNLFLLRFVPTNGNDSPLDDIWYLARADGGGGTTEKGSKRGGGKGKKK